MDGQQFDKLPKVKLWLEKYNVQKSRFCGSAITSRDELLCGKNFAIEEICETKERQRFFR